MRIRDEQLSSLRARAVGDGLLESFRGSGLTAAREEPTGPVFVKDRKGNATRFDFDAGGFVGAVNSPLGRVWLLENDGLGRPLSQTNPAGLRVDFEYNTQGQLATVTRRGAGTLQLSHDEQGSITKVAYPDGTETLAAYVEGGRLTSLTDRLGRTESFTYDAEGDLTAAADGNGNRTVFKYGALHRPDRTLYADGSAETFEYDPVGLPLRMTAADGAVAEFERDAEGRALRVTYPDEVLTFAYDGAGRVTEARAAGVVVRFEYDEEGRVTLEDCGGQVVAYSYDEQGTLESIRYPSGEEVAFTYDADLRLSEVKDWEGGLHSFTYEDGDGGYTLSAPGGVSARTELTDAGLPRSLIVSRGEEGGRLFSLAFQYDEDDRLVLFADSDYGSRQYAFDLENQLVAVGRNGQEVERFDYDGAGNRVLCGEGHASFDALNQLTSQGGARFRYDARGNLSDDGVWTYTYNARNLLVRAEGPGGLAVSFGYDAFGRRAWKQSGARRVRYAWAGETLVRESWTGAGGTEAQDYLYVPGTHTPLATRAGGRVYGYHNDHLGAPRRLTGADGEVVWSADYAAFGQAEVGVELARNPLRLPGQYFDEETGLHYNRFRYYSPALGRYLSRDPLSFLAGLNFYAYCGNDPVNSADPLGLWNWKSALKTAAVVVASVAVGAAVVALAPVALPLAIIAAGAAAGAVGFGLNEALNQEKFSPKCILKEAAKGALVGAVSAVPFAFLPAAGVAAYAGAGAASGAIGYTANYLAGRPDSQWSWKGFGASVGIGAATAGVGRYAGAKYGAWKEARLDSKFGKAQPPGGRGVKPFEQNADGSVVKNPTVQTPSRSNPLKLDPKKEYIWTVNNKGKLVVGEEVQTGVTEGTYVQKLGHPTLTEGAKSRVSGEIRFGEDGKPFINANSGRYTTPYPDRGPQQIQNAANLFKKSGTPVGVKLKK
ncbi:MAG TPA: RHS repeat-associated core domain-containing protein [Pyrinomonadaceae bacterium]